MTHAVNTKTKRIKMTLATLFLSGISCLSMASESMVTGPESGTNYKFGLDLKKFIEPSLNVLPSSGSVSNIKALSKQAGVSLGIVQADAFQTYMNIMKNDPDPENRQWAADIVSSLRVVMPLYDQEIYFIVRKDDPMRFIHEIEDKRIYMDIEGSGSNLAAKNTYVKMFGHAPNRVKPFIADGVKGDDDITKYRKSALWQLNHPGDGAADRQIDVVVLSGGQPMSILEKLGSDYKLLTVDVTDPHVEKLLEDYQLGTALKQYYPFLHTDTPVLTVKTYLITVAFRDKKRNDAVSQLASSICANFDKLTQQGHEKWKHIGWSPLNTKLPALASGWTYASNTQSILENCHAGSNTKQNYQSNTICTREDKAIGLCE